MNTQTDSHRTAPQANPHIDKAMQSVEAAVARAQADPERPVYHFLPPAYWMNDPNGPIYYYGWYHLFYQHNPYGEDWGYMHWGHTRSRDLVHWEHMPIGLAPSYEAGEEHVYSGCARVNGQGELLLFYTSVKTGTREERNGNEQWAARPLDAELVTWEKHPSNPVLALGTHGGPPFHKEWRDPFIFTAEGRNFLVLGADTDTSNLVALYEAVDDSLLRWRYCGPLVQEERIPGRFLECPNFVQLQASQPGGKPKWILLTSPYNPVEYTTGEFDVETLTFTPEQHGILDAGHRKHPNFYATNLLTDADGDWVLLGWVRDFDLGHGWSGALALPRLLTVDDDGHPRQQPYPALQSLRGQHHSAGAFPVADGSRVLSGIRGDALEIQVKLQLGTAAAAGLRVRSSDDGRAGFEIRWDGTTLTVAGVAVPLSAGSDRTLELQVFLDRSILEVFANGGRVAMTRVIYPPAQDQSVAVFVEQGAAEVLQAEAWQMNGIW